MRPGQASGRNKGGVRGQEDPDFQPIVKEFKNQGLGKVRPLASAL